MNSSVIKRRERGEVDEADITHFSSYGEPELLYLLRSEIPVERTCAAIHLRKILSTTVVTELCRQLAVEKKLYTKIALCESLAARAELSIEPLIELLGRIGKNQETKRRRGAFIKYRIHSHVILQPG
jgi:hypothetical protein